MRLPTYLRPQWQLFQKHHERLRTRPDPMKAEQKFQRRIERSRRVTIARTVLFAGLYFSFIGTALSFLLEQVDLLTAALAEEAVRLLRTVASSATVLFAAGILLCNRLLTYLAIDMHFYSTESRMAPRGP